MHLGVLLRWFPPDSSVEVITYLSSNFCTLFCLLSKCALPSFYVDESCLLTFRSDLKEKPSAQTVASHVLFYWFKDLMILERLNSLPDTSSLSRFRNVASRNHFFSSKALPELISVSVFPGQSPVNKVKRVSVTEEWDWGLSNFWTNLTSLTRNINFFPALWSHSFSV